MQIGGKIERIKIPETNSFMPKSKSSIDDNLYCKICKKRLGYFRGWDIFFPCQYCDKKLFDEWFSWLVKRGEDWRFEWGGQG
jgi:hypothetical protein